MKNEDIYRITKAENLGQFILRQQKNWLGHLIQSENCRLIKKLTFSCEPASKRGRTISTVKSTVIKANSAISETHVIRGLFSRV